MSVASQQAADVGILAGGSSTKSFRPEAKKEGGWVKTILEKSQFIEKNSTGIFRNFISISDQICA